MRTTIRTRAAILVVLVLVSLSMLYPFAFMLMNALKTNQEYLENPTGLPSHVSFSALAYILGSTDILQGAGNSLLVVGCAIVGTVVLASMAGYALAKLPFVGRQQAFIAIISGMMIPFQVIMVPLYIFVARLGWVSTYQLLIALYVTISLPFSVFLMRSYFAGLPDELLEAGQLDGCSHNGIFWRIMLPMARPAVFTVAVLSFVGLWNDLLVALIFMQDPSRRTITVDVANLVGQYLVDYPHLFAGLLLSSIPTILFFLAFQRHLRRGITVGISK